MTKEGKIFRGKENFGGGKDFKKKFCWNSAIGLICDLFTLSKSYKIIYKLFECKHILLLLLKSATWWYFALYLKVFQIKHTKSVCGRCANWALEARGRKTIKESIGVRNREGGTMLQIVLICLWRWLFQAVKY